MFSLTPRAVLGDTSHGGSDRASAELASTWDAPVRGRLVRGASCRGHCSVVRAACGPLVGGGTRSNPWRESRPLRGHRCPRSCGRGQGLDRAERSNSGNRFPLGLHIGRRCRARAGHGRSDRRRDRPCRGLAGHVPNLDPPQDVCRAGLWPGLLRRQPVRKATLACLRPLRQPGERRSAPRAKIIQGRTALVDGTDERRQGGERTVDGDVVE